MSFYGGINDEQKDFKKHFEEKAQDKQDSRAMALFPDKTVRW